MSPLQEKSVIEPTLTDVLTVLKQDIFSTLNAVKIGEIQTFDPEKKTASIKILFKRILPNGSSLSYPVLVDCPVFTLQGGGGFIQFPIAQGDQCLVLFSDRNLDAWYTNGMEAVPFSGRCHNIADGIALVGLNSQASTMPAYQSEKLVISYGGAQMEFSSGTIGFVSAESNSSIDLAAGTAAINNGAGGEVTISAASLIKVSNNTTSLLVLLNTLIDVIAAAMVQGPSDYPLTPATIAALQAHKLQLATLLE